MAKRKRQRRPTEDVVTFDLGRLVPREPPRTRSIRIRVTEQEHDDLKRAAEAYDVTVSELVRQVAKQICQSIEGEGT